LFGAVFLAFTWLITHLSHPFMGLYMIVSTLAAFVIVWEIAPVEALNRPMSDEKRVRFRNYCLLTTSFYMMLAVVITLKPAWQTLPVMFFHSGYVAAVLSMLAAAITDRSRRGRE
jgi:hypothetical protein